MFCCRKKNKGQIACRVIPPSDSRPEGKVPLSVVQLPSLNVCIKGQCKAGLAKVDFGCQVNLDFCHPMAQTPGLEQQLPNINEGQESKKLDLRLFLRDQETHDLETPIMPKKLASPTIQSPDARNNVERNFGNDSIRAKTRIAGHDISESGSRTSQVFKSLKEYREYIDRKVATYKKATPNFFAKYGSSETQKGPAICSNNFAKHRFQSHHQTTVLGRRNHLEIESPLKKTVEEDSLDHSNSQEPKIRKSMNDAEPAGDSNGRTPDCDYQLIEKESVESRLAFKKMGRFPSNRTRRNFLSEHAYDCDNLLQLKDASERAKSKKSNNYQLESNDQKVAILPTLDPSS